MAISNKQNKLAVYVGDELASYNFGAAHPFSPARHDAFYDAFSERGLSELAQVQMYSPVKCARDDIALFHDEAYIEKVISQSISGVGYLDCGDTPAIKGIYEAVCYVVGTALDATHKIMAGEHAQAFIPIAGLHHARPESASGFCVFNDCGIVIETLRQQYDLNCVAYVDIDAHHGDGVFYAFKDDPYVIFADMHEDGRYLYPGTGREQETGSGAGKGRKLNIAMEPAANDVAMLKRWPEVENLLREFKPDFIILQCGADSINGDPITHLKYSEKAHFHAAQRLTVLANEFGHGRVLALGGGGYNLSNIAKGWCAVVEGLLSV